MLAFGLSFLENTLLITIVDIFSIILYVSTFFLHSTFLHLDCKIIIRTSNTNLQTCNLIVLTWMLNVTRNGRMKAIYTSADKWHQICNMHLIYMYMSTCKLKTLTCSLFISACFLHMTSKYNFFMLQCTLKGYALWKSFLKVR